MRNLYKNFGLESILGMLLCFVSCGKYEQRGDKMYYSYWPNESGKVERIISEADLSSFKVLKGKVYAKDKNRVYYRGLVISDADVNTFKPLSDTYSVDYKHIFWEKHLLSTANPESFKILKDEYSLDSERVYYRKDTLKEANPATFRTIGDYYAKDANHVYSQGYLQTQVSDAASFELISSDGCGHKWARDKNFYYHYKSRIEADYATFTLIDKGKDGYAKDKNHVYYSYCLSKPIIVEGADPKTFKMVGKYKNIGQDKNGYYWSGEWTPKENLRNL